MYGRIKFALAKHLFRVKTKKFAFNYEQEVYDEGLVDQRYIDNFMAGLRRAVDEYEQSIRKEQL